jgi:IS30 family transposase
MAGHLTAAERDRIAQLFHQGATRIEIARALVRSPATIGRELARNGRGDEYFAAQAQEQARQRRRDRPLERKMDREAIGRVVHAGLTDYWSPDQIACRLRREHPDDPERHVSAQTIYSWIGRLPDEQRTHYQQFLRRRGMRPRRHRENTGENQAAGIADRPEVIEQRGRIGDFEGDTVLGPPGSGGLVTLVDRRSRYCILGKVASKHADRVHHKIRDRLQPLDEHQRRSLTFDNGSEFAQCHRLERHLETPLYFADPGCPYQRGTNENTNGLIRQFFPKGTDFRNITHHEVRRVENLLNNRPRACLDYQTPNEVFFGQSASPICD